MTNNVAAEYVKNCSSNIAYGNSRNYGPPDLSYRLWLSDVIVEGNPNTILVHRALLPTDQQEREKPNNCFHQLGPLLHNELNGNHNVWAFEYADEPVYDPLTGKAWYFNYGDLATYGENLKKAISIVRKCNPGTDVNIIAHSMGGLIARYAAQGVPKGTVNTIITLDTGHFGFEIAAFADAFVRKLPKDFQDRVRCTDQTPPGNEFLYALTKHFTHCRVKLLSLAAGRPLGGIITVVSPTSSSLAQVSDDGSVSYDPCTPFVIVDNVDHMSIGEINDESHPAFDLIVRFLNTGHIGIPVSRPSGDPYFAVVLEKEPLLHYPMLLSTEYSPLPTTIYPTIHYADTGHCAVIFKVPNVQADQDILVEYAPNQRKGGKLTTGQSTIRVEVIQV
jgi:hypothetical protein